MRYCVSLLLCIHTVCYKQADYSKNTLHSNDVTRTVRDHKFTADGRLSLTAMNEKWYTRCRGSGHTLGMGSDKHLQPRYHSDSKAFNSLKFVDNLLSGNDKWIQSNREDLTDVDCQTLNRHPEGLSWERCVPVASTDKRRMDIDSLHASHTEIATHAHYTEGIAHAQSLACQRRTTGLPAREGRPLAVDPSETAAKTLAIRRIDEKH